MKKLLEDITKICIDNNHNELRNASEEMKLTLLYSLYHYFYGDDDCLEDVLDNVYFDTDFEAAYLFGVTALPATIVIDEDGYFYGGINGALNYDYLNKLIDGELKLG